MVGVGISASSVVAALGQDDADRALFACRIDDIERTIGAFQKVVSAMQYFISGRKC